MKLSWDTRGCYQRIGKQFLVCAKCGHKYIDWIRKEVIREENKVLKRTFGKKLAEYNKKKKLKMGKGLKKPTVEQLPLLIRCNCHKRVHSGYSRTCPNQQCANGSRKLCNCSCSLVVSTTNYATVRIASSKAQEPTKSNGNVNNACEFLKAGPKVRKPAMEDAAEKYEMMVDDGKLECKMMRSLVAPSQSRLLLSWRSITSTTPQLMERMLD